jgi:signal transduction histidine kinase
MPAKPCLLVVDDEPDQVQSVKDLLRFDYRVLGATRATEGLKIADNEDVQVVMSDQRMPEMTGVEFLANLRDRHPEMVRLLFTAYSDLQAVTDAINQGNVYGYITKPYDPDELKTVLKQAVDHFNLQAERDRLLKEVQEKNLLLEVANRELQEANDLKRAFIKVASHELRTPLTMVVGMAELARSARLEGPMQGWLDKIYNASQRLRQRVDQMTTLLQAEQFQRPLERSETLVADLIRRAVEEVTSFIAQRKQKLEVDIPEGLGTLFVEPAKIHDSIVQLLVNAIKFTPDGGVVRIAASRTGAGVEIRVSDTGQGIEPECLPRVFEPFFTRFDVSRHCSGTYEFDRRGLGLGLPVVKAFVEMHGGTVSVESSPKSGTTFRILLPIASTAS